MIKENLPLELFEKHREALGLADAAFFEHENALFAEYPAPVKTAIVFLPKSKALIDMTLALLSGIVASGGTIVLAGTNKAGIRSAKDAYEKNIGPVGQKIVGNHSALYVGKNQKPGAGKTWRDFLSFAPITYKGPARSEGVAREATIEAAKLPGVFSAGELDEGTKLLLDTIPYKDAVHGRPIKILDIGSGAGIIGAFYKKFAPGSEVTMSDASLLAVKASEETLKKNGISARIIASDVFDRIEGAFDIILCNPPFHSGVQTDYSFIERFAAGTKAHLNKGGDVYVVANAFLPYQETLAKHIGPTEIVADDNKFRVYRSKSAS